ncbi:MAG: helix-turn-helix domain-containing protein [Deltaproteobacteria bacterium]|nr:helix-turn-helix domain-containing protein [Deltaproteobacteria bacterium]
MAIILSIVSRRSTPPLPSVNRILIELGHNLRLARQRRGITAVLLAERAGMSRTTLRALEKGDAAVTLGAVANVLHSLGLEKDLLGVGRDDVLGRKLQDANLDGKKRVRSPKASHGS